MVRGGAELTGKRRALLIATDDYSDATFQQLRAPRADTDALDAALADPTIGGYEVERLHNPPAHEAYLAIEDLFAAAWLDDLVLLYISGHGIRDDYGQLHLAMINSRHDRLNATAASAQFIRNQMDNTRSRRVVVLLDCCFAGAFPPGSTHRAGENAGVLAELGGHGSAVMTSSSALEYSFEAGDSASSTVVGSASPSVFTGALVEGLRSGDADRNGDGLIDVDELYDFIYAQVEVAGKPQTPGLDSRFQGRLIVASSPAATDLPAEVAQAMRSPLPSVRLAIVGELSALLNSESASAARAARTALEALTEDDASSVVTAAQAALARADNTTSQSTTVDMKREFVEQNSASSASPPVSSQSAAGGTDSEASGPTDHDGAAPQDADHEQRAQSPRSWNAVINAVIGLASAALAVAMVGALMVIPEPVSFNDDNAAPPPQHIEQVQIPPGFVPPPTRPTPLPASVTCEYPPEAGELARSVEPPANGEVPAKGIVRATINTNVGAIPAILDRSLAPCTVNDFVHVAEQGFYDNTECSKETGMFEDFPVTCGRLGEGAGQDGAPVDESLPELPLLRGYLTMSSSDRDFDIFHRDANMLGNYTVFGTVSEGGLNVIDNMRAESTYRLGDIVVTSVDVQA